jgi:hypothetical protein
MTNLRDHSAERELKFRAWDEDAGRFRTDITIRDGIAESSWGKEKPEWIVEQFTGLLDKNGKAIYEGDICTVKIYWNELLNKTIKRGFVSRIAYSEHRALWFFPDYHNVAIDDAREDIEEVISIEIIGTIHDAEYKELAK